MDLSPFLGINPCGFSQLNITQLSDLGGPSDLNGVANAFMEQLQLTLISLSKKPLTKEVAN